jgi:hypothetical protein
MFLSEDVQKAQAFGEFLHKHAKWELATPDVLQLNKHFAWFNYMVTKINDHVLELQKVHKAPEDKAEPKPEAKKGK